MCNFWHLVNGQVSCPNMAILKMGMYLGNCADRVKISSNSTPEVEMEYTFMYVQLLEIWQMAKLVLKQSVKAHGPLVIHVLLT